VLAGPELAPWRQMLKRHGVALRDPAHLEQIFAEDFRMTNLGGYANWYTRKADERDSSVAVDRLRWVRSFIGGL